VLAEASGLPRWELPELLTRLYSGSIGFPEQCTVVNFVETLDGVVAIPDVPRSNALIAAESDADRFVMALLRACADVILVGSGTLLASPQGTWRPERAYPPAGEALLELRRRRGLPEQPRVAVVSTGATLDVSHPVLPRGAIVLTTTAAEADLRASLPDGADVIAVNEGDSVDLAVALALLRKRGYGVVLSEGGPTVLASLLASRLVDELFLTMSPLVAGRAPGGVRLSLVEGVELLPDVRVEGALRSVRRSGSHLLLRYGLS
jgi:riboflavin biosynthesis pyrimidine reductase